jgi:DNA-binding CsgD family transcriptional regulator
VTTAEEWLEGFATSMPMLEGLRFGSVVVDARTGRVVATNPRARQLLGGPVPERVQDLVEAGVLARPSFDALVAAAGTHPASWRSEITLHRADGRADLVVFAGTVEHPGIDARVVVAMLAEQGRERIFVDYDMPDDAPFELRFTYDERLRIRGIDPRLGVYWDDPTEGLGGYVWLSMHPADIHLAAPWLERIVTGQLDRVEYTVRVHTHLGNWTPAHVELHRLLGDSDTPIVASMTLVGDFKETIDDGRLTPRELAVVAALFDGRRVPQIAARDGVSVKTLRNQLTAVYRKLGVTDQVELLGTYHRPADVPPPTPELKGWDIPEGRLG